MATRKAAKERPANVTLDTRNKNGPHYYKVRFRRHGRVIYEKFPFDPEETNMLSKMSREQAKRAASIFADEVALQYRKIGGPIEGQPDTTVLRDMIDWWLENIGEPNPKKTQDVGRLKTLKERSDDCPIRTILEGERQETVIGVVDISASQLKPQYITALLDELQHRERTKDGQLTGQPVKLATKKRYKELLAGVWREYARHHPGIKKLANPIREAEVSLLIDANPAELEENTDSEDRRILRYDQWTTLEEVLGGPGFHPAIRDVLVFLRWSGARVSEAAKITWNRIDFDAKLIHFVGTKSPKKDHVEKRAVVMIEELEELLRRRWEEAERPTNGWVFPAVRDPSKHLDRGTIYNNMERAQKGIPCFPQDYVFGPHNLRHTRCTEWGQDMLPFQAMKQSGHTNAETFLKHYTFISPEAKKLIEEGNRRRAALYQKTAPAENQPVETAGDVLDLSGLDEKTKRMLKSMIDAGRESEG